MQIMQLRRWKLHSYIFVQCSKTTILRGNLSIWIRNQLIIYTIKFTKATIILGYLDHSNYSKPLNTIILTTKCYIFRCCRNQVSPFQWNYKQVNTFLQKEGYIGNTYNISYHFRDNNFFRKNGKIGNFGKIWKNYKIYKVWCSYIW